ncbi:chromate transporter [Tepidimonas ignava]|uniref:Chromate transport protein n=1 Tax=Tepidimonas ignava TaxID=114249 RepID=A0A4R3LKF9_9BURK|nr:chromate transporter [Tepidimonas ignava]TCS99988.1 chromate transporter [Tepidimonas ignava]TSE19158.1 putative chromate transport protein [Tepidimonas ignava]
MTPLPVLDLGGLFTHFLTLSLLAIGGAITTAPDMHRYLVLQTGLLSDGDFARAIALAQAAPGPNILFVALMGWYAGVNASGGLGAGWAAWGWGALAMLTTLGAMLLPSSLLTYAAARWLHTHRAHPAVRAFQLGMAPVVLGLMAATGVLMLGAAATPAATAWRVWGLAAAVAVLVWRTRLHLLVLLAAGAMLGALGWV